MERFSATDNPGDDAMSYAANLDSALTYLKVGRIERAKESLLRALSAVPAEDKVASNDAYLKILALLAKLAFSDKSQNNAAEYIKEGLQVKADHVDLLFLNALSLLEEKKYDEMLAALGIFLVTVAPDERYSYEFANEKTIGEVLGNLLPLAYRRCVRRGELKVLFTRLTAAAGTARLAKALEVFANIDQAKEA